MSIGLNQADTARLRKARGAFFTPPEVAEYITRWAIRSADDLILEPSCGEAEFLVSGGERLHELGVPRRAEPRIRGIELHVASAKAAESITRRAGVSAHIRVGDFFDAALEPTFDAVIGNPPYVRYQAFSGEARAKAQRAALSAGVRLSGLASSWAAFVVRSATLLRPGGRLGLVLPAELLTVNYAASVRRFLLDRFSSVRLVMFNERVFPDVLAEVVLLLAEGEGGTNHIEVAQVRNLDGLGDPPSVRWSPPRPEAKWSPALLPPSAAEAYGTLLKRSLFSELEEWGRTDLGMVSGNNGYFCLSADDAAAVRLGEADLVKISPPGSRHLRGLAFTEADWRKMRDAGDRVFMFAPSAPRSKAARRYINAGEASGVPAAYKCRVREPWWQVPRVPVSDLFITYMNADTPRVIANDAGVPYLNSVHGVRLHPATRGVGRELLPLGSLNSLTLLGAELVGRSYGGGILKLEPKEADLLPVPSPALLRQLAGRMRPLRRRVAQHLSNGDLLAAVELVDRLVLAQGAGLGRVDVIELREARSFLFGRRATRGAS